MTDSNVKIHWFYRLTLLLLGVAVAYVVLQPSYNFAHWIPHSHLRAIGIPYEMLLAFESNADKLLHPLMGFVLTWLLLQARIPFLSLPPSRAWLVVLVLMIGAELWQFFIGRGFESLDITLGALAALLASVLFARQSQA
ncbi:MAG: hypothetical protein HKN50_00705 [Gammaproteobacteria bacterium]|nr:hypothetical protein [Gammaproteobacteria bacterium]